MRRAGIGLVALSLVLGACSSDDDKANDETKDETPAETDGTDDAVEVVAVEDIRIPVGDMTFDALAAGPEDGEAVVLLHGFPQTSESYRPQIEALAEAGYRAIAPNQRGYSPDARPAGVEAYAIANLIGDVTGMADSLGIDRFHLVGHDWGGAVAWAYASLNPDRLLSLSVLATPHPAAFGAAYNTPGSDQAARSGYMATFRAEGAEDQLLANDAAGLRTMMEVSGLDGEQFAPYLEVLGTPEALGAALNWYRAMNVSGAGALPPITTPTLYAFAADDIAFSREVADATGDFVTGPYQYEVLEGVSHWMTEDAPDEVTALLLDHIGSYPDS